MVSECADGFPDHGKFAEIFKMADTPQGILELIHDQTLRKLTNGKYKNKQVFKLLPMCMFIQNLLTNNLKTRC